MSIAIGAVGAALIIAAMFAKESGPRGAAVIFGLLFLTVFWFGALEVVFK